MFDLYRVGEIEPPVHKGVGQGPPYDILGIPL